MKVLIIILMALITIYAISVIEANGKAVKVGETMTGFRHLTFAACIMITVLAIAFNAACLYLLVYVV